MQGSYTNSRKLPEQRPDGNAIRYHDRSRLFRNYRHHHREWHWSNMKTALVVFVVLLIAFRIYLPFLAKDVFNRELNKDPLYSGHIDRVSISLYRGAYALEGVKISSIQGQKQFPLISADRAEAAVSWTDLIHFRMKANIHVRNFWVNFVREPTANGNTIKIGEPDERKRLNEAKQWRQVFRNLVPLDVSQLQVDGDSIHFRDLTSNPPVDLYLDELKFHGTNLTNSKNFSNTLFATIEAHGRAMNSGIFHSVMTFNPWVNPPVAHIALEMKGLALKELNPFFTAYGKFDVKAGTVDFSLEAATADGLVKGYMIPAVHDLQVTDFKIDKKKGVFHVAWEDIVGAVGWLFKNFPSKQQAAKIPFEGELKNPETDNWAAVKSVLYNMFVNPIHPKVDDSVKISEVGKK